MRQFGRRDDSSAEGEKRSGQMYRAGVKQPRDGETSDVLVLGQPRVSFQSVQHTHTHAVKQLEHEHMGNLHCPKQ